MSGADAGRQVVGQCREIVFVPEKMRYTGRGPSGFQRHYTRRQCKRDRQGGSIHCWQHDQQCFHSHAGVEPVAQPPDRAVE